MKKNDKQSTGLVLVISLMLTALAAAVSIPIGGGNDIYIDFTIKQPLTTSAFFSSVAVYGHPSTLIQAPALGDILSSGNIVVLAKTATKSGRTTVGNIARMSEESGTVVIRNVPETEKTITVELYEDNVYKSTHMVVLQ